MNFKPYDRDQQPLSLWVAFQCLVTQHERAALIQSGEAKRWQERIAQQRSAKAKPHVSERAVATKRDNYGAKGL